MSKYKYHRKDQHQQLRCGHRRFGNKFWYADFWYSTKRTSKFWIYPHFSKSHFKIQLESDPWLGTTAAKRRIASQEHIADGVGHQLSWNPHPKSTTRKRETSVSKDPHEQATSRFFLRSQTIRSHRLPPPTSPPPPCLHVYRRSSPPMRLPPSLPSHPRQPGLTITAAGQPLSVIRIYSGELR